MRNPVKGATLAGAALIVCQCPISAHLAGDFEGLLLQAQIGAERLEPEQPHSVPRAFPLSDPLPGASQAGPNQELPFRSVRGSNSRSAKSWAYMRGALDWHSPDDAAILSALGAVLG
jgi:hypothetical protein